jgi:recombination protein RecA
MAKREKLVVAMSPNGLKNNYFTSKKEHIQFVSTGCTLVDCALGGGFALGRVANIVGDKSTSKTGLATECLINFCRAYPEGLAAYRVVVAAFDNQFAQAMGLPLEKIDFGERLATVEGWYRDLEKFVDACLKADAPGIYVLDSLDALSDEAELERDFGEATFGGNKAKKSGELFRRLTAKIESSKVLLLVISQVRDNIGAMFGEKHKRSGGKALDFYASQIMWLAHLGQLSKTISKEKRVYGITVKANVKKNKIAMPFRQCEFEFHFGFGIEDVISNLNWLEDHGIKKNVSLDLTDEEYRELAVTLAEEVKEKWSEIEGSFLPKRTKYGTT